MLDFAQCTFPFATCVAIPKGKNSLPDLAINQDTKSRNNCDTRKTFKCNAQLGLKQPSVYACSISEAWKGSSTTQKKRSNTARAILTMFSWQNWNISHCASEVLTLGIEVLNGEGRKLVCKWRIHWRTIGFSKHILQPTCRDPQNYARSGCKMRFETLVSENRSLLFMMKGNSRRRESICMWATVGTQF